MLTGVDAIDLAALLLRLTVGTTMLAHGYNHGFGGGGIEGTTGWFRSMGLRPPKVHAYLSTAGEMAAGAGLILGLLTLPAAVFVVGTMTVAGLVVHRRNGFFIFEDGYEYVLVVAVAAVTVGLLGAGRISLDHVLGIGPLDGPAGAGLVAGAGILGALALLAFCWRPQPDETIAGSSAD